MIEFSLPWAAVLLPLPLLILYGLRAQELKQAALYFPAALGEPAAENRLARAAPRKRWRLLLTTLIWCLLVIAATGPRWIGKAIELPTSGRDLMLAVDFSKSMLTEDMRIDDAYTDRISVVKTLAAEFLRRRVGDRLGLIVFGSNAYLHVPLTHDRATVARLLEEAQIGFAGTETAIGDALGIAVKRLRQRPEHSRVVILMTDGANTAGVIAPRTAADLAAKAGLRIYTIGIGAEVLELPGLFGSDFGARRVNPSRDLDEGTLQYIAEATGGRYFRARDPRELQAIYDELDRLEPVEQDARVYRPMRSLHHWPLALAVALSLLLAGSLLPRSSFASLRGMQQ
jgi:Ca-activated chloride channel homolog